MKSSVSLKDKLGLRSIKAAIESRLPLAIYNRMFRRRFVSESVVDLREMRVFEMEAFPDCGPLPWLDRPDAPEKIEDLSVSRETADKYHQWRSDGYLVLEGLIDSATLDTAWAAYERAVEEKRIELPPSEYPNDPYPGRSLSPHLQVPEIDGLLNHPEICSWVKSLSGHTPIPYQTIASSSGSEQKVHSDSVHMTTFPLGYMIAAWIAVEDIDADCGPVVYYPGSHRLPYLSSRSVGITEKSADYSAYKAKYEPAIEALIEQENLKPEYLTVKKGDVMLWHANLLHGGSRRNNIELSRKAVVCHYFSEGTVSYHDLTGKQTFLDSNRVL